MASERRDEQEQEIDCLTSMFPEELSVIEKKPNFIFEISLNNISEDERDCEIMVNLRFHLGDNYPDEPPKISVTDSSDLTDEEVDGILENSKKVCEENLGMPMIFTVVMQVQDLLALALQRVVKEVRAEFDRRRLEEELAEKRRFEGTAVTIGSFLAWKKRFDAEMKEAKAKEAKARAHAPPQKPTGKELFLRNEALIDSDLSLPGAPAGIADNDEEIDSDEDESVQPDLGIDE